LVRLRTDYKLVSTADNTVLHRGRAWGESYIVLDPNFQLSEAQALEDAAQRMSLTMTSELSEGW
jgi:hypothetical protein